MGFGLGSALSLGGSLLGGLGKRKGGGQVAQSQLSVQPEYVQDIYEDFLAPGILDYADDPFYQYPMYRYDVSPDDPFYNPAFGRAQAYSDAVGGLFTAQQAAQEQPPVNGLGQAAQDELLGRMMVLEAAQNELPGLRGYERLLDTEEDDVLAKIGSGEYTLGSGIYRGGVMNKAGQPVTF